MQKKLKKIIAVSLLAFSIGHENAYGKAIPKPKVKPTIVLATTPNNKPIPRPKTKPSIVSPADSLAKSIPKPKPTIVPVVVPAQKPVHDPVIVRMPTPEPPPKDSAFTGMLMGVQLGYAFSDSRVTEKELQPNGRSSTSNVSGNNVISGLNLGYGHLFTQIFAGIEGSYNFTSLKNNKKSFSILPGVSKTNNRLADTWDISGRLGYLFSERVLPYVKLGYTSGELVSRTQDVNMGNGSKIKKLSGVILGAGCQYGLSDKISLGAGYTFATYQPFKYDRLGGGNVPVDNFQVRPRVNSVMLNMKFKIY